MRDGLVVLEDTFDHGLMIELLAYLRAHGFKTFIVSGGGVEFMQAWRMQGSMASHLNRSWAAWAKNVLSSGMAILC
jgi:hypothetical protein